MGRLFRKRVLLNYHSGEAADHLAHWGALVHPWLRLVDEIVVPSRYLQRVFASYGYRSRVIHNTVDTGTFRYRSRTSLRPRFVSTRCFEWYYGVEYTILAFALIKSKHPDATLLMAGTGRQEGELRRLTNALNLSGVQFLGPVAADAMPALLDRCDLLLNSSLVDNQPLSILEAAAAGLPIVSTGTGDIENMIEDGVSGTLVPERDPAAMARATCYLLAHPDLARTMAARAHARLDRFLWKRVRGQWCELYADLQSGSSRSRKDRMEEKRCAA
jgi:L-malate glycosyltransferase